MGVGAEAFLIDSTDHKINSLTIDPSKVIFGSLGVAWCTSTNLQSGRSASLSVKALVYQAGLRACAKY